MFSFSQRKKAVELSTHMRRICDLTTPNLVSIGVSESRASKRLNRSIPTLFCPWEDGEPILDECAIVLSSDISDGGVGLILNQPIRCETVVLGYWVRRSKMPEPAYFLGLAKRLQSIGGGFWTLGVELTEFANPSYGRQLAPMHRCAECLLPPERGGEPN